MPDTSKPITDSDIKEMLAKWTAPLFTSGPYSKLEPQTQVAVLGVFSALLAQAAYFASIDRMGEVRPRMECVKMATELNSSPHLNTLLLLTQIYMDALEDAPSEPLYEVRKEEIGKTVTRKEPAT